LKLPLAVKQAIVEGKLTEGQAKPLIGQDEKAIGEILPKIIDEHWSARKIEQYIVGLKTQTETNGKEELPMPYEAETKKLEKSLGLKVNVRTNTKGSGQMVIKFKDAAEFEKLNSRLLG
jgi:ParB-like chromosome segregation protein Spo0J